MQACKLAPGRSGNQLVRKTPGTPPNSPSKQTPPQQADGAWLLSTVSNLPKRTKGHCTTRCNLPPKDGLETSEPDRLVPLSRVALIIAHHEILFFPHDSLLNRPLLVCSSTPPYRLRLLRLHGPDQWNRISSTFTSYRTAHPP